MPEICRFFGIVIAMYYSEHNPPHFHVVYGHFKAEIAIHDLAVRSGRLPPRTLGLVMEWAMLHQEELLADWENARLKKPLTDIKPLE